MKDSPRRLEDLRRQYPIFRYERFEIERTASRLTARFQFHVPPDISFSPEVFFEPVAEGWNSIPEEFINNAIFHLGLVEAFSYWKATASPTIEVHAGRLTGEQTGWWEDLLLHGMGEFFYRNDIDFTAKDFVKIIPRAANGYSVFANALPSRSLLTIGGGETRLLWPPYLKILGDPLLA